ncbi:MAG: hypothetical protein R3346_01125 [Candidatus Spechtbacterales bacterium]|nr:hypothetical protein [Candidatus Spechtbacterales bacterium]
MLNFLKNNLNRMSFASSSEKGVVALSTVIIIIFVASVIVLSLVFVFLNRLESARNVGLSEQAYFAGESGAEDALLRILDPDKELPVTMPYTLSVGDATTSVNVGELPGGSRDIVSDGDANNRTRRIRVLLALDADEASFFHGAQVGDGGLIMANGSTVDGSVFSNGDIVGIGGVPDITGDAFVAGSSIIDGINVGANAKGRDILDSTVGADAIFSGTIDDTDITGNATADILSNCTVGGDAIYTTSITSCTVTGTTTQESPAPEDLDTVEMPISDEKIDEWKQAAEDGGIISSCDGAGEYKPSDGDRLGPVKIECDLVIDLTKEVIVEGYIWVRGDIYLQNSAVMKMDSSFGPFSSAVIADHPGNPGGRGVIDINNSAQLQGSGVEGSYLMGVSMNRSAEQGGGTVAISGGNSSTTSIYYAPHGKIVINNNVDLVEVTAYTLELANSVVVQYEQGLANMQFTAGPQAGYSIAAWEEE